MAREATPQPKLTGDLTSLITPPREVPTSSLKQQCEDVISFCYRAHQLSVESARRCGVSLQLIEKLSLAANPSPITKMPNEERDELLKTVRSAIRTAAPGHSGSFPDYFGNARSLAERYHRFITQGLDPISHKDPLETADPSIIARTLAEVLCLTIGHAQHMEQKQTALVVLSSLIAFTEKSLPAVSAWAMEMRGRALQVESDTAVPFLARL